MFNLTGSEIVFLLLLALVILGPEKLPEAVRKFGKAYGEFKKMAGGFQSELKTALDEPMREVRETAEAFRQAASIEGLGDLGFKDLLSGGSAAQTSTATPATPTPTSSPAQDDAIRRGPEVAGADDTPAAADPVEIVREPGIQFGTAAPPLQPAVTDEIVREPGIQFTSATPRPEQWSTVAANEPPLAGGSAASSVGSPAPDAEASPPAGDDGTTPA